MLSKSLFFTSVNKSNKQTNISREPGNIKMVFSFFHFLILKTPLTIISKNPEKDARLESKVEILTKLSEVFEIYFLYVIK